MPVGIVRLDPAGRIVEANGEFASWAGVADVPGRLLSDLLVETEDFLEHAEGPTRMYTCAADPERAAFLVRRDDEHGSVGVVIDATDRLAAGRRLRASLTLADRTRRRLELLLEASVSFSTATSVDRLADVLAVTAARAFAAESAAVYLYGADGHLSLAAGADPLAEWLGERALAASEPTWPHVIKLSGTRVDDGDETAAMFAEPMLATGMHALVAARITHGSETLGVFLCFFFHPRQFDDEATPLADALAGQAGQALSAMRLQRRLEHAATHDETTGLPNRRMLEEAPALLADRETAAIIFIDLDGFKHVNDRLGHDQGDRVLREVAGRLRGTIRHTDTVVRYGGDEFVVISDVTDADDAAVIAERLRATVEAPIDFLPPDIVLSASIGLTLAFGGLPITPVDSLIRAADQAMYRAKATGGNRVEVGV